MTTRPHRTHRAALALCTSLVSVCLMAPEASAGMRDEIRGTDAADVITGTATSDTIRALGGADSVRAGSGSDVVGGGRGNDRLLGGPASDGQPDVFRCGPGRDLVATYGFDPDEVDDFRGCERFDSSCRTMMRNSTQGRVTCSMPRHISSVVPSPHTT
jgi:hypothetical protein